jgi:hypothetical protein
LIFPTGNHCVDYSVQFPSLQLLVVRPSWDDDDDELYLYEFDYLNMTCINGITTFWKEYARIFNQFFSKNKIYRKTCLTLQRLDIPYELDRNGEQGIDKMYRLCPNVDKLAVMFPNVHNKWFNEARNDE